MIEVYHNEPPEDQREVRRFSDDALDIVWPDFYKHVATVDSDNLDEAYELTNTIEDVWWRNAGVVMRDEALVRGGARSTSVGDVLDLNGELFVVAGVGFVPMETIAQERVLWDAYIDLFGKEDFRPAHSLWQFWKLTRHPTAEGLATELDWLKLTPVQARRILHDLAQVGFPVVAERIK